MSVYSIKDLENFTQIKAHTLRIWEQRYNLLEPSRTETNIRFYTEEDLKKILNINLLYTNGFKISKIADLTTNEIQKYAGEILMRPGQDLDTNINTIIGHVIEFNEAAILIVFNEHHSNNSVENTFSNLFIPLLNKIGELWQVNTITVAHEHFLSNIIRRFLFVNTPEISDLKEIRGKALLFLRDNEFHEIGLLFYNYYLRTKGYHTIYIGQSTPDHNIITLAENIKPDLVFTSLVSQIDKKEFIGFMLKLENAFDLSKVYIGGFQLGVHKKYIPELINVIDSVDHLLFD